MELWLDQFVGLDTLVSYYTLSLAILSALQTSFIAYLYHRFLLTISTSMAVIDDIR